MLDIALSYGKFATSQSGGARESLLTLLNGVSEFINIRLDVYQTPPIDDQPSMNFDYQVYTKRLYDIPYLTWTDQVINRLQWGRYLRRKLNHDYDLLITQNKLAPSSVQVADKLNLPSLFFVRSMALTGHEKYHPGHNLMTSFRRSDLGGKIQYPFLSKNYHDYQRAATNATHTIANSEFTADKLEQLFGVDSVIIYPPIQLDRYRVTYNEEGYITMVNPRAEYKGADIFLDIATALPNDKFLLVGPISSTNIRQRANELSNVTHWGWCEDMREAYAETKVIVVPSRVKESFGRVPAEAMVSGIPCVVSNRGALPEVVGDTGEVVTSVDSTDRWVAAIQKALFSHDPTEQKQRVERFAARSQIQKLLDLIIDTSNVEFQN
jgi:glycosyltransferase involved in cell wall biosynthesis